MELIAFSESLQKTMYSGEVFYSIVTGKPVKKSVGPETRDEVRNGIVFLNKEDAREFLSTRKPGK